MSLSNKFSLLTWFSFIHLTAESGHFSVSHLIQQHKHCRLLVSHFIIVDVTRNTQILVSTSVAPSVHYPNSIRSPFTFYFCAVTEIDTIYSKHVLHSFNALFYCSWNTTATPHQKGDEELHTHTLSKLVHVAGGTLYYFSKAVVVVSFITFTFRLIMCRSLSFSFIHS